MQKLYITLLLLLFSILFAQSLLAQPLSEDFMGRVSAPTGAEVEVLKFKSDQVVYAGTNGSGLFVSYDAGSIWIKILGFPDEFPCIKDLLIVTNKDLYAATFGGGVYYSSNYGANWVPKNNGLKNLYVQALTITKNGKLVCGTYAGGIYYSDDNGDNWTRTDKGLRYDNITCLTTMANGFILAGTRGGGVYVSRDTCKSWKMSNTELTNFFINDFAKDESGKVYAATNGAGVMMTSDGITWNNYGTNFHYFESNKIIPLIDAAVSAVAVNKYQVIMGTRSAGIYFWDDIWNCWLNSGEFALGITACDVSPNGTILATRSIGDVTRSTDNGESWVICSKNIVDLNMEEYTGLDDFLNVYPSDFDNSLILISKTDSIRKVYKSYNHGNDWDYLGKFSCRKINDVEIAPDGNIMVAADEGMYASIDGGMNFKKVLTVPGKLEKYWEFYNIEYDAANQLWVATWTYLVPDTITKPPMQPEPYLEFANRIYKSTDDGKTWKNTDYGTMGLNDLYIDKQSKWFMSKGDFFVTSIDHGSTFIDEYPKNPGALVYGKNGDIYYYDTQNRIYQVPDRSISFNPQNLFADNMWSIQQMGCDLYGNLYVAVKVSTKLQGIIYDLYMSKDKGVLWRPVKGCYNMDRIRGICTDNIGYTFVLTNALYKILNPKVLTPPVMIVPKDGQKGEELNPIIAWERVPYAEEYEFQVDQIDDFLEPFEDNVTGDTTCKIVITLFHGHDFYWRIRSKTHSALSEWSEKYKFTIGELPPVLISPAKGEVGVPLNAELKWHSIKEATHYLIQVAEDENFDKMIFEQDNHTDTTITTNQLPGLVTYYWRIKAYTAVNASIWSEVWNFRTVLGPPELIYPENNSIDRLLSEQFKWHKAIETESYYIQIAKDLEFTDMFFEGSSGADTFKIIDKMIPETEYYWHIASTTIDGTSKYSETWKFNTLLKAISLRTPENGKVNVPCDVKFTWLEHNSGSQYQIQISKDPTFTTTVEDQNVNNILELQSTKLERYQTYYWRVRLIVGQRVGLWSDIWSFKTNIQVVELLNPPDKSIDQPNIIRFRWYAVAGAKYYQLQISKNEKFTDLVYSMDSLSKVEQYVEDLEPEVLYHWRVRAWNEESVGTAQWSDVWTFTTGKVTLILRNPKTGSLDVNIPTLLTWFPATSTEFYHLQVAIDANFGDIIFDQDSIYDTKASLSVIDLAVHTTYYWHVKGISKQYMTPWSETWHFTTASTSVKESQLFSSIKLYPNPTDSKSELNISYTETCDAKIFISTAEGKIIKSDAIRLLSGETRYEIDADILTSGTYYITIITPSGYITRELVVVK